MLPLLTTLVNTFGRIAWTHWPTKCAFRHQLPGILARPGSLHKHTQGCLWKARPFPEKWGAYKQQRHMFCTHCWCVWVCICKNAAVWGLVCVYTWAHTCITDIWTCRCVCISIGVCWPLPLRGQLGSCPREQGVHVETGWHHYCYCVV